MASIDKLIVTNIGALRGKHGRTQTRKILKALDALIRADAKRGVTTKLVAIDRKTDMKGIGNAVTKTTDRRQVKRAIDELAAHLQPHYIMLLGAPDVVPHQSLKNPLFDPPNDTDRRVETDLPYACDHKYSTEIRDFCGPTRVVGRLPDVQGVGDTAHLLKLLDSAVRWKTRSRSSYESCFGITAEAWKRSTRQSVRRLVGSQKGVGVSPTEGPKWKKTELGRRLHFINCHGDTLKAEFYGENEDDEDDQPVAHHAVGLPKAVKAGAVVAAECCYGAELFKPLANGPMGICQTYLHEGGAGFFGSTTIAYGPAVGNGLADLICIYFVQAVLDGASLGRATLTAQQKYVAEVGQMGPHDLKTLAQFVLLGDPSVHPVKPKAKPRSKTAGRATKTKSRSVADPRGLRRKRLAKRGASLAGSTATVGAALKSKLAADLRDRIMLAVGAHATGATASFRVEPPPDGAAVVAKTARGKKRKAKRTTIHVLVEERQPAKALAPTASDAVAPTARKQPAVPTASMLIAREVDGRLEEVTRVFRHSRPHTRPG